MFEKLKEAVAQLDEAEVLTEIRKHLADGADPWALLRACQDGMVQVGEKFDEGEYFVSDLMMAGAILKEASEVLKPVLQGQGGRGGGKVVIGTVKGDIHDIGKDLVVGLLEASGFDVTNLGVDVPEDRFVATAKETGATVVALSGLLTTAFDAMRDTVAAFDAAGLRPNVRIMIGGGPVDEGVRNYTKADAWGADAQAAVALCKQWTEG